MEFKQAIAIQETLQQSIDTFSDKLQRYPKGDMGLTPDEVRGSTEWQTDKRNFEDSMKNLRVFNQGFLKKFKKEYREYRENKKLTGNYAKRKGN